MDATPPEPTPPSTLHQTALRLVQVAQTLMAHLRSATRHGHAPITPMPRGFARNPQAAELRLARTLTWLTALAETIAGQTRYLRPYRLPRMPGMPGMPGMPRMPNAAPKLPRTDAQRQQSQESYIRTVFATEPVARIADRLARRVGLRPQHPAWPAELMDITSTPASIATDIVHARNREAYAELLAEENPDPDPDHDNDQDDNQPPPDRIPPPAPRRIFSARPGERPAFTPENLAFAKRMMEIRMSMKPKDPKPSGLLRVPLPVTPFHRRE